MSGLNVCLHKLLCLQLHASHSWVHVCVCVCCQKHSSILCLHLEQKLVLHDPLDGLDEQVVELQAVAQLLPELLAAQRGNISQLTATMHHTASDIQKTFNHREEKRGHKETYVSFVNVTLKRQKTAGKKKSSQKNICSKNARVRNENVSHLKVSLNILRDNMF